jgi:hypothetical protein
MKQAVLIMAVGAMFAPVVHAEDDPLCAALRGFAESLPASGVRSVTIETKWGAQPSIACVRGEDRHSAKLCEQLIETLSLESMSMNVRRAAECLGTQIPGDSAADPLAPLSGKLTVEKPPIASRALRVEMQYDSTQKGEAATYLTLTFTTL